MSYSESKKLTDTEKKLEALKTQLFGKEENQFKKNAYPQINKTLIHQKVSTETTIKHHDLTYFRHDLLKIFILATIAISIELIIYVQLTFKILKF